MKLVKSLALVIGLMCVAYFVGATAYQFTLDSDHNGTAEVRVDTDGNTEIAGTLAVTGAQTNAGDTRINGILSVSADTANGLMYLGGSFTTLPTSGFSAGTVIYVTGGTYTPDSPAFWGSTATVTTVSCWKALSN